MAGEGIYTLQDDCLDLLVIFGAPGMVQAPKSFEEGATNFAATRLLLSRDRSAMDAATAPVDVPASATLAFERNKRLGAGVNLNSTLDGFGNEPVKPGTIKKIAKAGFKSVRIPILWPAHMEASAPYTIDPAFFAKVDAVVDECIANGLAVILDNHYYPVISFGFTPQDLSYSDNIDRLYSLWQQVSAHYKGYADEDVYFGLMNEPSLQLDPSLYNEIIACCSKIIRQDNPGKTIIVGTPSLGQHWTIGLLQLPADDWNIIAEAHYYLPQTFTHQGIEFAMAGSIKDIPWMGSEADKAPLEEDFAFLSRWSQRTGRPVSISEFGACDNADVASRARYIGFVQSQAREYGFSTMIWSFYRDGFSIYDDASGKWNNSLLKALKLK
jgi:endoglucanase